MISLLNVDLIGIDTNHPLLAIDSLLISSRNVEFGRIVLFTCADKSEFDPEIVEKIEFIKIDKFKEYIDYSTFCLRLADYLHNDYVLITHWDSFVVCPERWTDTFLKYDYIGAPFANIYAKQWGLQNSVGNGGFSLRSRKFLQFASKFKTTEGNNEDGFLINVKYKEAISAGIRYAPVELAYKFSVHHLEDVGGVYNPAKYFGFHGYHNIPIAKKYLEEEHSEVERSVATETE